MKTKSIILVLLGLQTAIHLHALPMKRLTFDEIQNNSASAKYLGSSYKEQGFGIHSSYNDSPYALGNWGELASNFAGKKALYNNYALHKTSLGRDDGGKFNIYSIDISELLKTGLGGTVNFTGIRQDGSKVTQTFTLDGLFGFQRFTFKGFENLKKLEWNSGGNSASFMTQFANLLLATDDPDPTSGSGVNVPDGGATIALLGLAFAGIFLFNAKGGRLFTSRKEKVS